MNILTTTQRNQVIDELIVELSDRLNNLKSDRKDFTDKQLATLEKLVGEQYLQVNSSDEKRIYGELLSIIRYNLYNLQSVSTTQPSTSGN
ncbi:hypothetical protein [Psychrobacter sp. I-STPA10]|uniref:hypothetical protein n=1 Tax=Psychrobacter sp. I-STPA10 TaxID=2585769 RepID=UPI001E5A02D5|nr:hypothetical protein [Psychrobacter sp. I-STPA10]